jgi:superfamily I DNA/RNA helicase
MALKSWYKVVNRERISARANRSTDFDDLLYLPYHLFRAHGDILTRYQNRFNHI